MAKSTKNALILCLAFSAVAVLAALLGYWKSLPLAILAGMLPAVAYETYRTEGATTTLASWGIAAAIVAEAVLILFKIELNIMRYLGSFAGFLPVFDVKMAGPIVIGILSITLLKRTAGIYTKWLAVVIFLSACALFYVLDPDLFSRLFKSGLSEGAKHIPRP
jgi:hypothetical protein